MSRSCSRLTAILLVAAGCSPAIPAASALPRPSPSVPRMVDAPPSPASIPGIPQTFTAVAVGFSDPTNGLLAGSLGDGSGLLVRTRDGGASWTPVGVSDQPLSDVAVSGNEAWTLARCDDPSTCPATIRRSGDAGATWSTVVARKGGLTGIKGIAVGGSRAWTIGQPQPAAGGAAEGRDLRRSDDMGLTWAPVDDPCQPWAPELVDVSFVDTQHGWALCGGTGSGTMGPAGVFETIDGGTSWALRSGTGLPQPVIAGRAPGGPVQGFVMTGGGHGWVWQGRSGTASTVDRGVTWIPSPPGDPEIVFVASMSAPDDRHVFAVVSGWRDRLAGLVQSDDGGATWRAVAVHSQD